ncbi:MAG: LuxR family transcriptional regulator, maltose regulon positive regulatory protein, partial [Pseudonocardiales bacterium]|nr:LuxR family transcriptional regulator, maltose regulon positive regulatory protein [Pseudonocardiales bacterium]
MGGGESQPHPSPAPALAQRGHGQPRLATPLIERPQLLDRLDSRRPLTVLRAPPGFGKTTLAAQWLRGRATPTKITAWLRPPATDDPDVFWSALVEALAQAGLSITADSAGSAPTAALDRALRRAGPPVLLVIDDLDNVSDPTVDDHLVQLLREAPRLRLLITLHGGRRFRAGWVTDLDTTIVHAADLLFTGKETTELAAALMAPQPPTAADAVYRECAGWPGLTRAVLVEIAGRRLPAREAEIVAIVDEIAGEFLRDRLSREPATPGLLDFALTTSATEELTVALVEALTEDPAAKTYLEHWASAGALLVDRRRGEPVYSWPPAARRLLAAELHRQHPGRIAPLHARLAEFYLDDHPGWAIGHAVQAQDWPLVVRIIDAAWRALLVEHRERLYDAITATPPSYLRTSRRATAMRDVMLQVSASEMLTTNVLPGAPEALKVLSRSDDAPEQLEVALAVLVAFRNCASVEDARSVALRVLDLARATRAAHPAAIAKLFPSVLAQVGAALLAAGDRARALDPYREAYQRASEGSFDYVARDAASKLAFIHALDGDLRRASLWLRRYEDAPTTSSWLSAYFEPAVATAALLTALDRLSIREAVGISDHVAAPLFPERFRGLYLYGRALLALHDGTIADLLDELDEASSEQRDLATAGRNEAALLAAAKADLLLALGRGNQARAVLFGAYRDHPALRVSHARLALLTGDHATALRYANDPQWERRAGVRSRQELTLIHAVAAYRSGHHAIASQALNRVAEAARATGALRPLVTVPRHELHQMVDDVPAAAELLAAEPVARHPDVFPESVAVVTLTQREQLVLGKLATGLTLQQTADALVVSYNTIRTQQASIYRKLGV